MTTQRWENVSPMTVGVWHSNLKPFHPPKCSWCHVLECDTGSDVCGLCSWLYGSAEPAAPRPQPLLATAQKHVWADHGYGAYCQHCGVDRQDSNSLMCRGSRDVIIGRHLPPMHDESDYAEVCADRDRYIARCAELEARLAQIREVVK